MSRAMPLSLMCFILLIVAREDARSEEPVATVTDINGKLDEIRVPAMEISAIPFRLAVGRLHEAAKRKVNMVIKCDDDQLDKPVTVSVREGSLRDALDALADAAGVKMQVDSQSVSFLPLSD